MTSASHDHVMQLQRLFAQGAESRGRAYRVLIVDDEPRVLELLSDFCASSEVVRADLVSSVAEARARLSEDRYDLVTFDLVMPEMSGIEGLNFVRREHPQVPVLIITGNSTDKLINEAGVAGAVQVLEKPISLPHFLSALWKGLNRPGATTGSKS